MKPRLSFLTGLLIGILSAGWIIGAFAVIAHDGDEYRLAALESSIGKVTGAFDLAFDEKIPARKMRRK